MVTFDLDALKYAALGGTILGIATSLNYILRGKVTGMSGIVYGIVSLNKSELPQKLSIVGGMLMASALVFLKYGYDRVGGFEPFGPKQSIATWTSLAGFCVAGFLVGFGTKLANGCTSGHGLCGLPRFSLRSFVAVCTFLTTAIGVSTYDYYFGLGPIAGSVFNGIYLTNDHNITAKVTLALGAILPVIGFAVSSKKNVVDQAITFTVGALFSLGLMVSGMSRRTNILQFLQINQSWNPALLFVLGCGLLVNLVTFTYMRKRQDSLCGGKVFDPKGGVIDWQLVVGAACFGAGWGIAGICPGPFLVLSSVSTVPIQVYFGVSMIGGMFAARFVAQLCESKKKAT